MPVSLSHSRGTFMSVTATFLHRDGYRFNIFYQTKGGFLRALARSKNSILDNAVDGTQVITNSNLQQYREGKLKEAR